MFGDTACYVCLHFINYLTFFLSILVYVSSIACTMLFCVPQVTECCYPSPAPHFSTFKGTSD